MIPMKLRNVHSLIPGVFLFLVASTAQGTGPNKVVRILEIDASGSLDLRIAIDTDGVAEVDVESRLSTYGLAEKQVRFAGVSVLDPRTASAADCAQIAADSVCAGNGDVLVLPWPHAVTLSAGLYSERIEVRIVVDGLDEPLEYATRRYFEVRNSGLIPLTAAEYSARVLPVTTLPDGRRVVPGGSASDFTRRSSVMGEARRSPFSKGSVVLPNSEVNEP